MPREERNPPPGWKRFLSLSRMPREERNPPRPPEPSSSPAAVDVLAPAARLPSHPQQRRRRRAAAAAQGRDVGVVRAEGGGPEGVGHAGGGAARERRGAGARAAPGLSPAARA